MKNLSIAFVMVLAFASYSFAKLAFIPLDEAIENSDLIVIGTLKDITEKGERNAIVYGKGLIYVEKIIAGNVKSNEGLSLKSGDKLRLNYVESFSCVYGSHERIENEKGIFLLTLNDNGEIETEDFRSLESLDEIMRILKKGIKPNEVLKTINILDESKSNSKIEASKNQPSKTSFCMYSIQSKPTKYSPISALLVILTSILLYYLLYRSRFKIR